MTLINLSQAEKALLDREKYLGLHLAFGKRKKSTDGTYNYFGWALPGTSPNEAKWFIIRETISSTDITFPVLDPDGFTHVWANRASLQYDET